MGWLTPILLISHALLFNTNSYRNIISLLIYSLKQGGLVNLYTNISETDIYDKFKTNFKITSKYKAKVLLLGIDTFDASQLKAKYIVCPCTNTNHIKINPSQELISLKDMDLSPVRSTAEHTIFLTLAVAKHSPMKPGQRFKRPYRPATLLAGKRLGIIGYGRVGKQVKQMAEALNMFVWTCDVKDPSFEMDAISILKESDFIVITASIQKDQIPIIGKDELAQIKDGAYIVNTSRGEAVDEKELLKHIKRLGGYATDVVSANGNSPYLDSMLGHDNILITPHTAGFTAEDMERTSAYCYGILQKKLQR